MLTYPKLPLPANLPFLVNDPRASARTLVAKLFDSGEAMDLPYILQDLARYWPVKVWFSEPLTIRTRKRRFRVKSEESSHWQRCYHCKYDETTDNHVFRGFFMYGTTLCYKTTKQGRRGHIFEFFDKMVKYEPVFKLSRKD